MDEFFFLQSVFMNKYTVTKKYINIRVNTNKTRDGQIFLYISYFVARSGKMKTTGAQYGEETNICRRKESDREWDGAKWDQLNIDKQTLTTQFGFRCIIAANGSAHRSKQIVHFLIRQEIEF